MNGRCHARLGAMLLAAVTLLAGPVVAAETIRVGLQRTGTFAFELAVVRSHGFDKEAGISIEPRELASPEAGEIALAGGAVDLVVSDWLWVARERRLGIDVVFYPYSGALGAVMVPKDSTIHTLGDLVGKTLSVGGGPLDKSWLLLQAAARKQGLDLKTQASIVYGAPALLYAKMLQHEADATLNFWTYCTALEAKGFRRLLGIEAILPQFGVAARPSLLGYVFQAGWAKSHPQAIRGFIEATRRAKDVLATSDAEWTRIAPLVGAGDAAALATYRDRYRQGIPKRSIAAEEADARTLFAVLAKLGGRALVGEATELAPGTFYDTAAAP